MDTLFTNWSSQTRKRISALFWDQWISLGVNGNRTHPPIAPAYVPILDPESLLLATFVLGRQEPRLFDEALDWASCNGRWLSLQRMKNGVSEWSDEYLDRAFRAFNTWMSGIDKKGRWKNTKAPRTNQHKLQSTSPEIPLFLDSSGQPHPILTETDPAYQRHAILRPTIKLRSMSQRVSMLTPEAFLLRMRSLFGLSPRAEIVSILMARGSETLTGLTIACGYSRASLSAVLADLQASGEVQEERISGSTRWMIGNNSILHALDETIRQSLPLVWFQWLPIYRALLLLDRTLAGLMQPGMTRPAIDAALCDLSDNMDLELVDVGFSSPFHEKLHFDRAFIDMQGRVDLLFSRLTGCSHPASSDTSRHL